MLIRTQNRLEVVILNHSDCLTIEKVFKTESDYSITAYNMDAGTELGTYKTKDRALEVLDEICNAYINLNQGNLVTCTGYVKNGIYQMPEE